MTYAIIQPPFSMKFWEMSKKDLNNYFEWFHEIMPIRLEGLTSAVRQTPEFETWQADFTPASLEQLGAWFAAQVETRPRTEEEIQEIQADSPVPIEIPGDELTNRTFSLAMDIAMYLSNVFFKSHPVLKWDQQFGNKKFVDYGQPVLVGFGAVPFNPVRMMVTLAYGAVSKRKSGDSLYELYAIWSKMISS